MRFTRISSIIREHWVAIGIGSVGWIVNLFHYVYDYFKYKHTLSIHLLSLDTLLVLIWIPGFMLAGYLYDRKLVSERKAWESEEKYRTLVEKSNDGIVVIQEGLLKFVNSKMLELTGFTQEEVLNKPFTNYISQKYREMVAEFYKRRLCGEEVPIRYEIEIISKDGRMIPFEVNASLITYEGKPADMAILRDISERKEMEKKLRESEEKFRTLAEESPNMIFINQGGRVVYANRMCEEVMGYSREEFYSPGFDFLSLIAPESRDLVVENFQRHMRGEEVPPYEYTLLTKDGRRIIGLHLTKLIEYQGERAILGIVTDVTEYRIMEDKLKSYLSKLEESNRLKDLFTDILRHDLLNPVSVIKGLAEVASPEEYKDVMEIIRRNAEKLEEMIQSAGVLAKVESEEKLEFEECDLKEILKEVITNFKPIAERRSIRMELEDEKKYLAWVHPSIEEVFSNLLSNAIKYSPDKSTITVRVDEDGEGWRIQVRDEGMGVPDEHKELIFERFTRKNKIGVIGTGLGLAIVKRIVELHGGRVWVEDNNPVGSIFCVWIPKRPNKIVNKDN